jgi:hypothetical protein
MYAFFFRTVLHFRHSTFFPPPYTQLTRVDEEKLQPSLTRFFRRLSSSSPVERNNWIIQVLPPMPAPSSSLEHSQLEELAWAEGTFGPEDMLAAGPRPAPPKPLPERMRLRVERQTLRRLPRSGAIVFTIRVYLTPLAELGPGEAGRLAAAIRGVKEQEAVYRWAWFPLPGVVPDELFACACARHRGHSSFEDAALEWLDGQHRDEIERGLADQQ